MTAPARGGLHSAGCGCHTAAMSRNMMAGLVPMLVALGATLGGAGCGKKAGWKAVEDCPGAVDLLIKSYGKTMVSALPFDLQAKYTGLVSDAMVASCKEDRWPAEVGTCLKAAQTERALMECGDKLKTRHFQHRLQARFAPILDTAVVETMQFNKDLAAKRKAAEAAEESDE